MFPLMDLPYDILFEIVPFISRKDLSAVSRTTRKLRDHLQPLLFKEFDAEFNLEQPGFTSFLQAILESLRLARCVKSVSTERWRAASIFADYGADYHKTPLSKDARVMFWAIRSSNLPQEMKKRMLKGFKREVFIKDKDLQEKLHKKFRAFSKPDIFLAMLITHLPNLEDLRLSISDCDKWDKKWPRSRNSRVYFPFWTWKIVELNASNDIQQGSRSLQNLKRVTISHSYSLFNCPRGLPWLLLPSITALKLSKIRILSGLELSASSSNVEELRLSEIAISLAGLTSLLRAPKKLLTFSHNPPFAYSERLGKGISPTKVIDLLRQCQSSTLNALSVQVEDSRDKFLFGPEGYSALPPDTFDGFRTLRSLRLSSQYFADYDQDGRDGFDDITYKFMTSLVDLLPPTLEKLTIDRRLKSLIAPLKDLASSCAYPAYNFPRLALVRVRRPLRGEIGEDERDVREALGNCNFEFGDDTEDEDWI